MCFALSPRVRDKTCLINLAGEICPLPASGGKCLGLELSLYTSSLTGDVEEHRKKRTKELEAKFNDPCTKLNMLNKITKHMDLGSAKEMLQDALQDIKQTLK